MVNDLPDLLAAFFSQTISPEQMDRLEHALAHEPGAAVLFLRYAIDQNLLEHHVRVNSANQLLGLEDEVEKPAEDPERAEAWRQIALLAEMEANAPAEALADLTDRVNAPRRASHHDGGHRKEVARTETGSIRVYVIPKAVVWLGVAAVLGVVVWLGMPTSKPAPKHLDDSTVVVTPTPKPIPAPAPLEAVAEIRSSVNARWIGLAPDSVSLHPGQSVTLAEGVAECRFGSSASIILEGPVEVVFIDANTIRLNQGRVAAMVPPAATGFRVFTPTGLITDIGTEFGVDVQATGQTTTHVFQGLVNLRMKDRSGQISEQDAQANQTWVTDEAGTRRDDTAAAGLSFLRSVPSRYELAVRRLGPLGYWRFDGDTNGRAAAGLGPQTYEGIYAGALTIGVPGPELGGPTPNTAVAFDGTDGQVLIPDSPEITAPSHAYTISLWVKPEAIGAQNIMARTSDIGPHTDFAQQLRLTKDGRFEHYLYTDGPQGIMKTQTGVTAVQTGRWYHVVIAADEVAGTARLFVNGIEDAAPLSLDLLLWKAGNQYRIAVPTGQPGRHKPEHVMAAFRGAVDEVAVFDRALSAKEVLEMFDAAAAQTSPDAAGDR